MATDPNETCPNCGAKIKISIISENFYIRQKEVDFINRFTENTSLKYCQKCSGDLLAKATKEYYLLKTRLETLIENNFTKLNDLSFNIPIVTLHSPQDWKYQSLEMVSAQTVTGTGVFAEIASSWTDFFGMTSGVYNKKLKDSEEKCKNILRSQAVRIGGNAVLGTDIDYSEAGAGKGMLMVCMAGTAVKITNLEDLGFNIDYLNKVQDIITVISESELELEEILRHENSLQY